MLSSTSSGNPLNDDDKMFFGVDTFSRLIKTLLIISSELSAEILLLLKDEIFCHPDCCFFALLIIKKEIKIVKDNIGSKNTNKNNHSSNNDNFIRNALDMLRMIDINENEEIDPTIFLINGKGQIDDDDNDNDNNIDDYNDTSSEDEKEEEIRRQSNVKKGRQRQTKKEEIKTKKRKFMSRHEQLLDWSSHRKIFSGTWLAFLSLPLTSAQHKIVLKHLPDHVICYIENPLLLADYLTKSYEKGGVTAVLALESLFHLIVKYNLDYPNFFISLYKLCTEEVFGAKYRTKFMNLLNTCLKSTNLPAYMVASFIKKLAHLALRGSSPSALFCIAQLTWLLQKHPQCKPLLHQKEIQLIAEYD